MCTHVAGTVHVVGTVHIYRIVEPIYNYFYLCWLNKKLILVFILR